MEVTQHHSGASLRLKMQMLVGMAFGFLLVVMFGVASADDTPTSDPALPEIELAPAVVVAAGADSINTNAVSRLSADIDGTIERGTAFQLEDGRLATVAHALIDARIAVLGEPLNEELDLSTTSISRLHDLAAVAVDQLPTGLSIAAEPGQVGQVVALAGVPASGRIEIVTGEIISRTSGTGYGIGRPDIYVIAAPVEPGWSGGPVVDANGDVIAIIVGRETRSGVTLAVPIEYLPEP